MHNENFVGHKLLRPGNAKIKYRDGHMGNNVQMVNSDTLFSSNMPCTLCSFYIMRE